jgi:hypothetical protein
MDPIRYNSADEMISGELSRLGIIQDEMNTQEDDTILVTVLGNVGTIPHIRRQSPAYNVPCKYWEYKALKKKGYKIYDLRFEVPEDDINTLIELSQNEAKKAILDKEDKVIAAESVTEEDIQAGRFVYDEFGRLVANPEWTGDAVAPEELDPRIDKASIRAEEKLEKKKGNLSSSRDKLNDLFSDINNHFKVKDTDGDRDGRLYEGMQSKEENLGGIPLTADQLALMSLGITNITPTPEQAEALAQQAHDAILQSQARKSNKSVFIPRDTSIRTDSVDKSYLDQVKKFVSSNSAGEPERNPIANALRRK